MQGEHQQHGHVTGSVDRLSKEGAKERWGDVVRVLHF